MSTYSPNLRIELITNGTQAGTWGDTTNGNLAYVLDSAVAGYQLVTINTTNQALTYTSGPTTTASANQSVYAMLKFATNTGAAFNVFAPPVSKMYIIWNSSLLYSMNIYNSLSFGGTTPISGAAFVTVAANTKVLVWSDGTNFYEVQAQNLTGTLAIANGGTGQTTANAAFNALAPVQTTANGKYLKSDGTNTSWDAIDISTADITGTLPVANGGTGVTSSTGSGSNVLSTSPSLTTPILGTPQSGNFSTGTFTWPTFNQNTTGTAAGLSSTLAVTSGGTGATTASGARTNLGLVIGTDVLSPSGSAANLINFPTLNQNTTGTAAGLSSTLAVSSGGTGNASQSQYAVLYAATTSSLTGNPSVLSFDGTNLGIGTNSPSTYGKLTVLGTGSFTNSLVSTSATAADYPTLEFRKTRNTAGGSENNAIGRLSFYSRNGTTITESAYISVTDTRIASLPYPQIVLVSYSQAVGTNLASLTIGGTQTRLFSGLSTGIVYEASGGSHTFTGNVVFNDTVTGTISNATNVSGTGTVTVANLATAAKPIGAGQTWQDFPVPSTRANNIGYTNNTGRPIVVSISAYYTTNQGIQLIVDGVTVAQAGWSSLGGGAVGGTVSAIVPAGSTYQCSTASGVSGTQLWAELR